nr:uncharacterized protein LOC108125308 [Drosophila bipectinata]
MSPTEFSNYIKQRAMQQQMHHGHGNVSSTPLLPPIGLDVMTPIRSLSPNQNALQSNQHGGTLRGQQNFFESNFSTDSNAGVFANGATGLASKYLEPCYLYNGYSESASALGKLAQLQPVVMNKPSIDENGFGLELDCELADVAVFDEANATNTVSTSAVVTSAVSAAAAAAAVIISIAGEKSHENKPNEPLTVGVVPSLSATAAAAAVTAAKYSSDQLQQTHGSSSVTNSKLINGISSFYSTGSSYQQLLLAN